MNRDEHDFSAGRPGDRRRQDRGITALERTVDPGRDPLGAPCLMMGGRVLRAVFAWGHNGSLR